MTLLLPPFLPPEPPQVGRKPMLPGIWQTISDSGIDLNLSGLHALWMHPEVDHHPPKQTQDMMSYVPKRKRKTSKRTIFTEFQKRVLNNWLSSHKQNPYPTLIEKQELMTETGLTRDQINVWFTNNRIRHGLTASHAHGDH